MNPEVAKRAKHASIRMAGLTGSQKNVALAGISRALSDHAEAIFQANQTDLDHAREEAVRPVLIKRLKFDGDKLQAALAGIESLIGLSDPVQYRDPATYRLSA